MGEGGRGLDDVLAVVQDQHHRPVAERGDDPIGRLGVRRVGEQRIAQSQRGERRLCHVAFCADGRELHQPDPIRKLVAHFGGDPQP